MRAPVSAAPAGGLGLMLILVLVSTIGPLSMNIAVPVLPTFQRVFAVHRDTAALVLSLFLAGMAVAQLALGPLADRYGRRPVLLGGLVLYVAASLAAMAAASIDQLLLARVAQALGATAGLPLARTILRDLYDRERSASMIGYLTMGMVVAPMVSPLLGALLAERFGWPAIFAVCAAMGAFALATVAAALPETRPAALREASAREVLDRSLALLRQVRFWGFSGTTAMSSGAFFAFQGAAPFLVIETMGRDKAEYALWFLLTAGCYMAGNFVSGRYAQRAGVERMLAWGNGGTLVGTGLLLALALAGWNVPLALFAPLAVTAFFNALTMPSAIAGAISVDPHAAGAASGLVGVLQFGLAAIAAVLAAAVTGADGVPLGLIMVSFAIAGLWLGHAALRAEARA